MTYILGVNEGHNATACLLKDGEVVSCASEERFARKKNCSGIPMEAMKYCLQDSNISLEQVDRVVFTTATMPPFSIADQQGPEIFWIRQFKRIESIILQLFNSQFVKDIHLALYNRFAKYLGRSIIGKRTEYFCRLFSYPPEKVVSADHHLCHALGALFSYPISADGCLIFTLDGEGDLLSGTVSVYKDRRFKRVLSIPIADSMGWFYMAVTVILGMKPHEHEYKVMGLAPYSEEAGVKKVLLNIGDIFNVDDNGQIVAKVHMRGVYDYLKTRLEGMRFDYIAGAAQHILEQTLIRFFKMAIEKTGIKNCYLGGGVFMNVKANMRLLNEIPMIGHFYPMPSCGDESNAIGAAYYGYQQLKGDEDIKPLRNVYLGPAFHNEDIEAMLEKTRAKERFEVQKCENIENSIVEILCAGKIVARVSGRMEFGARSLGNRSILAHPSFPDLVYILNKQIKNRDFWMPFAATVLKERTADYLKGRIDVESPYMMIAYETTELGRKHFKAAIHPYDKTMRPQILSKEDNPSYYALIQRFEEKTGVGGLLNTSFNLHGEPMVCSPFDALSTFERSGLEYLVLQDYLISKHTASLDL